MPGSGAPAGGMDPAATSGGPQAPATGASSSSGGGTSTWKQSFPVKIRPSFFLDRACAAADPPLAPTAGVRPSFRRQFTGRVCQPNQRTGVVRADRLAADADGPGGVPKGWAVRWAAAAAPDIVDRPRALRRRPVRPVTAPLTRLSFCCTPLLPLVGVSIVMERERQRNGSLVRGYRRSSLPPPPRTPLHAPWHVLPVQFQGAGTC